jgi:hypothetical protein
MGNPKRPININKETCSPISSNCVIWQGPDIPCLNLCKGATVTEVVYELATDFCNLYEQLSPDRYNFECLNLEGCPPETFKDLFQVIINRVCELSETQQPNTDCCDTYIPRTVRYVTDRLGTAESGIVPTTSYTIPAGGEGTYEFSFIADAVIRSGTGLSINVYRNGVAVDTITERSASLNTENSDDSAMFSIVLLVSEIVANVGDTLDVRLSTSGVDAFLSLGVTKITKIS